MRACEICGYTGEGLVQHHPVPKRKLKEAVDRARAEFMSRKADELSTLELGPLMARMLGEIRRAVPQPREVTICANCHAELHAFYRRKKCKEIPDFLNATEEFVKDKRETRGR